jgi:outer membrane biosynthesis protein TonB
LFIFLLAWKQPFPPLPEYGIEVNFGLVDAGSGDIQPTTPANTNPTPVEDPAPEEPASSQEPVPEQVTEPAEESAEEQVEEVVEEAAPVEEAVVTQPQPSVTPAKETPREQPVREEPVKETPKPNPASTYPNRDSNTDGARGNEGDSREPASSNQGDQPGETGDQGNPDGKVDARALYGNPGGGEGGAALDMAGWEWDSKPEPNDKSNESGKIVFRITIDDEGEILSIQTIEKQVSDALVKKYEAEVRKLTFSKTSANSRPAPTSTGHITFIIRAR